LGRIESPTSRYIFIEFMEDNNCSRVVLFMNNYILQSIKEFLEASGFGNEGKK